MPDLSFLTFPDLLDQFFVREGVEQEILRRYQARAATMVVDFTSMVRRTDAEGIVYALALARAAERAMMPAVRARGGEQVKRVADSFFAVFGRPTDALDAAFEGLRAVAAFNRDRTGHIGDGTRSDPIHPCVGLGFGPTLVIQGTDLYGEETNRAFVLGEDTANGNEVLVTDAFLAALGDLPAGIGAFRAPADRVEAAGFPFHMLRDYRD